MLKYLNISSAFFATFEFLTLKFSLPPVDFYKVFWAGSAAAGAGSRGALNKLMSSHNKSQQLVAGTAKGKAECNVMLRLSRKGVRSQGVARAMNRIRHT